MHWTSHFEGLSTRTPKRIFAAWLIDLCTLCRLLDLSVQGTDWTPLRSYTCSGEDRCFLKPLLYYLIWRCAHYTASVFYLMLIAAHEERMAKKCRILMTRSPYLCMSSYLYIYIYVVYMSSTIYIFIYMGSEGLCLLVSERSATGSISMYSTIWC